MLAYKDFHLEKTVPVGTIIKIQVMDTLEAALMRANAWIEETSAEARLLSVETIPEGIRVWYTTRVLLRTGETDTGGR